MMQHPQTLPMLQTINHKSSLAWATACFLFCNMMIAPVWAHAVLDRQVVAPGQALHLSIAIGHGCDGSGTTRVSVTIPEGIIVTKVDTQERFKSQTRAAKFEKPWTGAQGQVVEGIKDITWSEGLLADKVRGEFGFELYASDDLKLDQVLSFPVVQICEQGERRWVEEAAQTEAREKLKAPAPVLKIVKKEQAHLDIRNARSRVTPNGAPVAGGYVTIRNWGDKADRLIAATVSVSDQVEIHEMSMSDGVMRMRALDKGLEIPAGATVELKTGSYHLMFIKPKRALSEGEWIDGTLTFERGGVVPVRFKVDGMGGNQGGHAHAH